MNKALKIPLIILAVGFLWFFVYRGLYLELYVQGVGFSISTILLAFLGTLMLCLLPFLIALSISYTYYRFKELKDEKKVFAGFKGFLHLLLLGVAILLLILFISPSYKEYALQQPYFVATLLIGLVIIAYYSIKKGNFKLIK